MAQTTMIHELEEARRLLWTVDRRRHAADDAVGQLLERGMYSGPEYLTAKLEVADAHMVSRGIAERAVMTAVVASRPRKAEVEDARELLSGILREYAWHHSALNDIVRSVRQRHEEESRAEPARPRRHRGSTLPAAAPGNPPGPTSRPAVARR